MQQSRSPLLRSRPMVIGSVAVFLATAGIVQCRPKGSLEDLMDDDSMTRMSSVPRNGNVVLSLHGNAPWPDVVRNDSVTVVGQGADFVLVRAPVRVIERMPSDGAARVVLWGEGGILRRIPNDLRQSLLDRLASAERSEEPISLIAEFDESDENLRRRLIETGASPRSVIGRIVTLDAPPRAVFRILAMNSLIRIDLPRVYRPLGANRGHPEE